MTASRPPSTSSRPSSCSTTASPDATGTDILAELAATPATAAIPVVALSSDTDNVIAQLIAAGATEAVPKPFGIHQFIAMIDRYRP